MTASAVIVVSLDSKPGEALFLRSRLGAAGVPVTILDFGIQQDPLFAPDIAAVEVARRGGSRLEALRENGKRGEALDVMARGAAAIVAEMHARGELLSVISVGGSGGTTVGTAAMRTLPLGVPKVMVSTIASGDTRPFVDISDIVMLNSVADFAGINPISETILTNAAGALAGMIAARAAAPTSGSAGKLIAATMFGVTTPLVEKCRVLLEQAGYTLVPFHATGIGGRTMESLIADGFFAGVLDLTTTEWADEVVGGSLSAGPARLEAAARAGIPQVIAPGALDMVNFVGTAGVPEHFAGRTVHRHSDSVHLMRTTPAENAAIGRRIAEKLNAAIGPVTVLFPLQGVSALDRAGNPFFSPDADQALLAALRGALRPAIRLETLDCHINDDVFARAAVEALLANLPPATTGPPMPMIAGSDKNKVFPDWSETQNFGVSHIKVGGEVEPHFHDCHEYWIIISGRGDAMSEGKPYELGPGDMLLTKAGDYHSLVVTEEMVAVYYYGVMPEHGRWGHLHEGVDLPWDEYLASKGLKAAAE